jgi:hypothetical protein
MPCCLSCRVIASSGAILVNKHIMIDLHFPYPASVCAIGLVGTSIVSWTAVRVLRIVPASTTVSLRFFITRIMPTGLFQALSMQLGNTAYLHLSGGWQLLCLLLCWRHLHVCRSMQ